MTAPTPRPRRPFGWYRPTGLATRAHVAARWATAPFGPIDALVPSSGRVLDWGCGHGVLALWLAAAPGARTVVGVDIDDAKLAHARSAAAAAGLEGRASFELVAPGARPTAGAGWDAIVVDDVLYLLDPVDQEALVRAGARALAPGGVLVVKEMDHAPRWKHAVTRAQEVVAVRILRFTATAGPLHAAPTPAQVAAWMEDEGLETSQLRLDQGYHVPHAAAVGRRASVGAEGGTLPS